MPNPIVDVPCQNGRINGICAAWLGLEPIVGWYDDLYPELPSRCDGFPMRINAVVEAQLRVGFADPEPATPRIPVLELRC